MPGFDRPIRVLTWNIHKGIGPNGRYNLDRTVRLISRHAPDIVALQEVDARRAAGGASPFEALRQTLGEHSVEARTITAPDGDYGHVIISRWPLAGPTLHDISVRRREPRQAIEATVETDRGPLHVMAAHLGLAFGERRRQVRILADAVRRAPAPVVLLGDFNDWIWRGHVNRALVAELPARTWHRTFPALCPLIRLDRIYCRPATALIRSWTDADACWASDHLPVIAEISLQPPDQGRPRRATPEGRRRSLE